MTRGQWTLIGVLFVQLLLIAVLHQPGSAGATEARPLTPGFDRAAVTRIEVSSPKGDAIDIERDGSGWKITSASGYPADSEKVGELLDKVGEANVRTPVVTSSRYHDSLEVSEERAQAHIRLFAADDVEPIVDLFVGKSTTGGAHVRRSGDEEVFDIRGLSPWQFRPDTTTWMQKKLVDVPTDSVTILGVTNEHGSFEIEKDGERWLVASPDESSGRACNADKVNAVVRAVASLTSTGVGGPVDPVSQGLGDGATVVTLRHGEKTVTVRIGGPVPDKDGQVYVTRDGFGFAGTQWESSLKSAMNAKLGELLQE